MHPFLSRTPTRNHTPIGVAGGRVPARYMYPHRLTDPPTHRPTDPPTHRPNDPTTQRPNDPLPPLPQSASQDMLMDDSASFVGDSEAEAVAALNEESQLSEGTSHGDVSMSMDDSQ